MSSIRSLKPKEIIKALEKIGFVKDRIKGSHVILIKPGITVPVPFHNKDIKIGTLKSILRIAKISIEDLLNNL